MAKLNDNQSTLQFAAAVTAMSLGTSKRLMRNFQYYRQENPEIVSKNNCLRIYREIRINLFGLQNMYLDENEECTNTGSSFKVMLAKQVQDGFEELHRKLLFFDADLIADLIPVLDRQRSFWAELVKPEFYNRDLPAKLDRHLISDFRAMEEELLTLPEFSS